MSEIEELRAKLLRKVDTGKRTLGFGSVSHDGKAAMGGHEPIMALANPDGPEAAALLSLQEKQIERLREYARHNGLCGIVGGYGYCTCGLDAALNDVGGA